MNYILNINDVDLEIKAEAGEKLLNVLRRNGIFSVKHGCESGECGACAILLDGKPVNSCLLLVAQVEGHKIQTIEQMGEHPQQGWKASQGLHPLQQAFVESGAIQCGYCTPAQILAAKELLERNPNPSEDEVRQALSGVLCRCTGYVKPVQAVLRAAAVMRGEKIDPIGASDLEPLIPAPSEWLPDQENPLDGGGSAPSEALPGVITRSKVMPRMQTTTKAETWHTVGKPEQKVDAVKLVQGKPAFAADIEKRGMLIAKVLLSPLAHARIKNIDASRALALPGVAAVLTWKDLPRVALFDCRAV